MLWTDAITTPDGALRAGYSRALSPSDLRGEVSVLGQQLVLEHPYVPSLLIPGGLCVLSLRAPHPCLALIPLLCLC